MITRLKINGFKNLIDVEIRFGAFTCIAGPNAVGKSNLFDALRFLSHLANDTLVNSALAIRAEEGRTTDIRSIFSRIGDNYADRMSFDIEMIVPQNATDDLGQKAEAKITFVRYKLEIGYRENPALPILGSLELLHEELEHINLGEASKLLKFPHSANSWRKSVLTGRRTSPFISTSFNPNDEKIVKLSQDGNQGRPKSLLAKNLPRTVLSTVNAIESPTALIVRREMQSWRLLQLEPSALREPDSFTTQPGILSNGAHMPATLYRLASVDPGFDQDKNRSFVYDQITRRLAELIDDVYDVKVDRDNKRELLTLQVTDKYKSKYHARSLSDGTLRFLALAVIDLDESLIGTICMEEPENGIHPERIPAMLRLLQDIACDIEEPVGPDNPLRQVIVNTHSPVVVNQVVADDLLVAETQEIKQENRSFRGVKFNWLPGTWRHDAEPSKRPISKGQLLSYLNPISESDSYPEIKVSKKLLTVFEKYGRQLKFGFDK